MKVPAAAWGEQRPRRNLQFFRHLLLLALCGFTGGNLWIAIRAHGRIFSDVKQVPANATGLVLGTSARTRGGGENPFFVGRRLAAAELYRAGKVRHLVLSGDDRRQGNDEPRDMRAALAVLGVPEEATTPDPGGFRTLDSMARARELFGVSRLTIITDDFHAERAILQARHFGIDAVAYTSRPVPFWRSKKTRAREIGARFAALLDLYGRRTAPHVAGQRVDLPLSHP